MSRTYSASSPTASFSPASMSQTVSITLSHANSSCGAVCTSDSGTATLVRATAWWSVGLLPTYATISVTAQTSLRSAFSDNTTPGAPSGC